MYIWFFSFLPWLLFPLWRKAPRDIQPENIVISGLKDTNRAKRVPDTRPLTDLFPLLDLTRFNFQNHRVLGKPKHHVYPKYPNYPEIPGIPGSTRHTQKYLRVNKVHGNTRSNISTLLPDLNPPATWLFFQCLTRTSWLPYSADSLWLGLVFHDKYQWEIWKNTAGKSANKGHKAI